jgi:hypothetical protein
LATKAKRAGDFSIAEQLFNRGLKLVTQGPRYEMSESESLGRVELGRMLEEQGLYNRALDAYSSTCVCDVVAERRLSLLIRLGRLLEAAEFVESVLKTNSPNSLPKTTLEGQRLAVLGMAQIPVTSWQLEFGAGCIKSALSREGEGMSELAARAIGLQNSQVWEMGRVLSSKVLRDNLLATGDALQRGEIQRLVKDVIVSGGNDWR